MAERYTVVYEGSPAGARILNGEPAPGRAVTVAMGNAFDDAEALRRENDVLRASVANGAGPCLYCALPRNRWSECQRGFPGCARVDDAMLCLHDG